MFNTDEAVNKAVDEMNGKEVNESRVKVEVAGQPKKPKGPQPNDECRSCGKKGHWYIFIYVGKTIVLSSEDRSTCLFSQKKKEKKQIIEFLIFIVLFLERQKEKVKESLS